MTIDTIEPHTTVDRRYGETTVLPAAIREISAPSILPPQKVDAQPDCRTDLVQLDGQPLGVSVNHDAMVRLLAGEAVDAAPCVASPLDMTAGSHRLTTTSGLTTGLDVDRVVLRSPQQPDGLAQVQPTVTVRRSRTSRTATVTDCPTGCWLILGEGYNDGWQATMGGTDLGAPRQISGGSNGWWLPGSSSPVTVTMTWTPSARCGSECCWQRWLCSPVEC